MRFSTRKLRSSAKGGAGTPKKSKSPNGTRKRSKSPPKTDCAAALNNDACLAHQIAALGLTRLESPDDGNCFFASLETYFKLMEAPLAETHMKLAVVVILLLAELDALFPAELVAYTVNV
jgi:hypothetical protein